MTIRCYGGPNVPDLLMARPYAERMWAERERHRPLAAIAGALLLPVRQAALRRDPPVHASFVISEHVLTGLERRRKRPDIEIAQLHRLRESADDRHASIRIHHFESPLLPPPGGAFTITTDRGGRHTVFVEAPGEPGGLLTLQDHRSVTLYAEWFAALSEASLDEDGSRVRIDKALKERHRLPGAGLDAVCDKAASEPRPRRVSASSEDASGLT